MIAASIGAGTLTGALSAAYLVAGIVVATWLERAGQPRGAVLGALVAWPLLVPLLGGEPAPRGAGPLRPRIEAALRALEDTLGDPAARDVPWTADLTGLRDALIAADARLALVDRLLADAEGDASSAAAELRDARAERVAAIEAVLVEVQQLRLQVGVAALAGDGGALAERLRELSGRARALGELTALR